MWYVWKKKDGGDVWLYAIVTIERCPFRYGTLVDPLWTTKKEKAMRHLSLMGAIAHAIEVGGVAVPAVVRHKKVKRD